MSSIHSFAIRRSRWADLTQTMQIVLRAEGMARERADSQGEIMKCEELVRIEREHAASELASNDFERISSSLLRLSLHDPDPLWLQQLLLQYLRHDHHWVRRVAALGLAHVARIHRQLDMNVVVPAIRELLVCPETMGDAEQVLDEIHVFMRDETENK